MLFSHVPSYIPTRRIFSKPADAEQSVGYQAVILQIRPKINDPVPQRHQKTVSVYGSMRGAQTSIFKHSSSCLLTGVWIRATPTFGLVTSDIKYSLVD